MTSGADDPEGAPSLQPARPVPSAPPGPSATATAPPPAGLWSPERRGLTVGLVLTITLVAFESLAIATVMPEVKDDLGGLALYGWVFSGFFLANILGIVVAGQLADRRGLALPFTAGLVLFAIGLVVGGLAGSMPVLVAGRVAQGFGAGAIPAVAYASIGRGYPAALRPRMFATISTAWVVPGLIGPAIATVVEHAWSWRVVFLGLLPITAVAGTMAVPAMRALGTPAGTSVAAADDRRRLARVGLLVLGVGAVLGAATDAPLALGAVLVLLGLPLASWAFVGLVPAGTVRLAPGVPATVAVRG
ncbi:MAG TPA: MFS transporter, partial [Aquihabitans sp.]|nr:MFS transporter [Aquihabitans sp.]